MVAETAVWRDRLTPAERAQLGREPGTITEQRPDILVVGGGIVGVATATRSPGRCARGRPERRSGPPDR